MTYWRLISVPIIALIWLTVTESGMVSKLILPSPVHVFSLFGHASTMKQLGADTLITLFRLLVGFAIGGIVAVPLGILLGSYRSAYEAGSVVVDFARSIPVASLFPLFLLAFGVGETSKYATTAWSSGLIVLINTVFGVRSVSTARLRMMRSIDANRIQVFRVVTFPNALPHIFAGTRTAISIGLIVVIITEMFFGSTEGLGYRIYNASVLYQTPQMYLGILLTGALGYLLNLILDRFESQVVHWRGRM